MTGAHVTEEDLILHHYGEPVDRDAIETHLAGCPSCRAARASLAEVLALAGDQEAPERDAGYEARVWRRLAPRLESPGRSPRWRAPVWPGAPRLAIAASLIVMISAAFLAGYFWPRGTPAGIATTAGSAGAIPGPVRERILLLAVGDHLEQSQMLLVELFNESDANGAGDGTVDISGRQRHAEELVTASRIYRATAASAGDTAVAVVLEELERVLLEVARGPSRITTAELDELGRRVREKGILFRARVIGSQVQEREKQAARVPPPNRT